MAEIPKLLNRSVEFIKKHGGSDIHLLEGQQPRLRIGGDLVPAGSKQDPIFVAKRDIEAVLDTYLTAEQRKTFAETQDIDFSIELEGAAGRVNVGYANGGMLCLTMRYLPATIIPIDKLGINAQMLKKLAKSESGLIIVAGETSSGKTTTIAAMLDYINHFRYGAITTIENPVEYHLESDKCLITRREIGRDTPDFTTAVRESVRKNPDVLLIGEIRDYETAITAMSAAETGILTFCTLHAIGALPAITRLSNIVISAVQTEENFYLRISTALKGIINQQLVKKAAGAGRMPLYEILNITYIEKDYLREKDFSHLEQSLENERNISLGRCIHGLWHATPRLIAEDTIKGIYGDQFNLAMTRLAAVDYKPMASEYK